jgi:hypothetical protein
MRFRISNLQGFSWCFWINPKMAIPVAERGTRFDMAGQGNADPDFLRALISTASRCWSFESSAGVSPASVSLSMAGKTPALLNALKSRISDIPSPSCFDTCGCANLKENAP